MTILDHTPQTSTASGRHGLALLAVLAVASSITLAGVRGAEVVAGPSFVAEVMDPRMVALTTIGPGVMKSLGVEAILFADDHVEIPVPPGFGIRMARLREIADGLVDYAGDLGLEPTVFDAIIADGELEAMAGLWTTIDLDRAAADLVEMNTTIDNRAGFSASYMSGNAFTERDVIDFTALTMKTLMSADVAQDNPTLFDSISNARASQLHVDVTQIWGDLGSRIEALSWITADRGPAAEDALEVSYGPAF